MKILFFDLETSPNLGYFWGLFNQNISLGQVVKATEILCFGARWMGSKKVIFKSVHHDGKKAMLEELYRLMHEADYISGWNSKGFDHKLINSSFILNGMLPPSPTKDLDLLSTSRANFRFTSQKLDWVARSLEIGEKVKHQGFQLWVKCMADDPKAWREMKKYQIQDVNILIDLYEQFKPWMGNSHPNAAIFNGKPDSCIVCGSDNIQSRGRAYTSTGAYPRFQCTSCGKWQRGKTSLASSNNRHI
jgi:hypothetical protein